MSEQTLDQNTFRRSSSTNQKEPILHEALTKETYNSNIQNLIIGSSNSSSSTSITPVISASPTINRTNFGGFSHRVREELECSVKDAENDSTLFNTLTDTKGLKSVRSHMELAKTAHSVRALAKRLNRATIHLNLGSVLIVTKARDNSLVYLTKEMTEWLLTSYPTLNVYVDKQLRNSHRFDATGIVNEIENSKSRLRFWNKTLIKEGQVPFDFVITLGGDGTVLHASTLFQSAVPPIISFSLGSLGFLTCFEYEHFREIITGVITHGVKTDLRMRFSCCVHKANGEIVCEQQVLNELTVDRGPSPYVTMLELYGDDTLLTIAQADGLIIATPTGSTAYNLSAGGSLVHPEVSCICITPICPHTLSFRPIMVPDTIKLKVKVPLRSRSTAWAAFDGRTRVKLDVGDYVTICASRFPFPTVKSDHGQYFETVSRVLNWNSRKEQKSFKHLLSDKNKKMCDENDIECGEFSEKEDYDIDYSEKEEDC
jgi:NAD+ kinase